MVSALRPTEQTSGKRITVLLYSDCIGSVLNWKCFFKTLPSSLHFCCVKKFKPLVHKPLRMINPKVIDSLRRQFGATLRHIDVGRVRVRYDGGAWATLILYKRAQALLWLISQLWEEHYATLPLEGPKNPAPSQGRKSSFNIVRAPPHEALVNFNDAV